MCALPHTPAAMPGDAMNTPNDNQSGERALPMP